MQTPLLHNIPEAFKDKIFFDEGRLYIAESLWGHDQTLSFLSLVKRRASILEIIRLSDHEIKKKTGSLVSVSGVKADEASIQAYAKWLIQKAYDMVASDIHITDNGATTVIQFRRMSLVKDFTTLPGEDGRRLIRAIYQTMGSSTDSQFSASERQDGRIVRRDWLPPNVFSVRIHTEPIEAIDAIDGSGTYMALRLLYDSVTVVGKVIDRIKALGYNDTDAAKIRFLTQRKGLIIIAGPVGSGKSTVLKHIMEGQAEEVPEKNYLSSEDPAEYPMRGVKQIKLNLSNNSLTQALSDGLSGILRGDPNVVLYGEIRYPETAEAALTATLTGHAVWATLHALDAFEIITRLRNLLVKSYPGDPMDMLCNYKVLAGLIFQLLIPTLCPKCKRPMQEYLNRPDTSVDEYILPDDVLKRMSKIRQADICVRGPGCEHCQHLGFSGRTLAVEVVVTDANLLNLLRQGKQDEASQYWKDHLGGKSHVEHAIEFIEQGIADPVKTEEILGVPLNMNTAIAHLIKQGEV